MTKTLQRWSPIWKPPSEEFREIIRSSDTLKEIIIKIGMSPNTGSYYTLNKRIKEEQIDLSHLHRKLKKKLSEWNSANKFTAYPLEHVLVENSSYPRHALKRRLIKDKLLENKCAKCELLPEWNGRILSLQLDHINGINNDNRLENLRLLCPNCHTQTGTFAGKNVVGPNYQKTPKIVYVCNICGGNKNSKKSKSCRSCQRKGLSKPLNLNEVCVYASEFGFSAAGRKYGLSDNGIKRKLKIAHLIN